MLLCNWMMRLVITFFLSLCFLLLRGGDHLYAHTSQNHSRYSPAELPKRSEQSGLGTVKNTQSAIRKADQSGAQDEAISATETEDDEEWISPRKYVQITNYFINFFYAHLTGLAHRGLNNRFPFCKHFSYTSSDIYIVQRVIRV